MNITRNIRKMLALAYALLGFSALNIDAAPAWTTGSCAPSAWTAFSDNLLAGQTGTTVGNLSYLANHVASLTDGSVPDPVTAEGLCGFCNGTTIEWEFDAPKTLEKIRLSAQTYWSGKQYHRINVANIEVKYSNNGAWESIDAPVLNFSSDTAEGNVPSATLENAATGVLAEGIVAIKFSFATDGTYAYYCAEIEAVGSTEATGPVLGSFDITSAKTKAKVTGSISDAGTDATACDIYLALGGGVATKIAEGVSGSFEYQIQGLTAGTEYAYTLAVSNNAPTPKGSMRSGTFATLAADAQTMTWATSEGVPTDFSPLANNLLAGMVGTTSSSPSGYGGSVDLLTNGEVSDVTKQTVGFGENVTVAWSFSSPKTVEKIRFTTCYTAGNGMYDDIKISKIEIKTSVSDSWTDIGVEALNYAGTGTSGTALFATLTDAETGFLGQGVTALRITFGKPNNVAQYYAEIEAVGFTEATGPVIGSFNITPAKTKAKFAGSIADPGSDATECDVYLSVGGGASRKVASGVTGSFECQVKNLMAGTTYAYELCVSNNAPAARGTVRSGTFTTLAADAQTASWTRGEYATADWTALSGNILSDLVATESSGVSFAASQDVSKLTDASVPNPATGTETVGFTPNGTIAWTFGRPMTIEALRISSLWESTQYNGISVNAIQVKLRGSTDWVALDVPTVQWTGGTQLGQTETLSDLENGYLARNAVALKITFGTQKAAVANYYAEIEAVGHPSSEDRPPLVIMLR